MAEKLNVGIEEGANTQPVVEVGDSLMKLELTEVT